MWAAEALEEVPGILVEPSGIVLLLTPLGDACSGGMR